MVWEKKNYSGSQNSPTDLSEILWKFSADVKTEKGQALTPSALTGMRAAIHHHLTCTALSQNINILQDSKFMSANKMLTGLNWMLFYLDMNDILYVYMHQIFRFFYRKTITTTWKLMEVRVACLGLKQLAQYKFERVYFNSHISLIVVKAHSRLCKHFLKE